MLHDKRIFTPPAHKRPILHRDVLLMSFENQWQIRQIYQEIIGLEGIDHFSINIVDPQGEMSIISYSPAIIYNIFRDGSYLYNGSISPTYYENLNFYTWDQCYDRRFYTQVKDSLQTKNNIETGLVFVHKEKGFHLLFSFATKAKSGYMLEKAISCNQEFLRIGFHCFDKIKPIYTNYYESNELLLIKAPTHVKPIGDTGLRLIVDNTKEDLR